VDAEGGKPTVNAALCVTDLSILRIGVYGSCLYHQPQVGLLLVSDCLCCDNDNWWPAGPEEETKKFVECDLQQPLVEMDEIIKRLIKHRFVRIKK